MYIFDRWGSNRRRSTNVDPLPTTRTDRYILYIHATRARHSARPCRAIIGSRQSYPGWSIVNLASLLRALQSAYYRRQRMDACRIAGAGRIAIELTC